MVPRREKHIKELNTIRKNLSQVALKIAFCYPNTYQAGMASLGLQLIYRLWNSYEEVACERTFLPLYEETEPYTLESNQPLREMDVLAFTMQYEDDYTNILKILQRAKIPLRSSDRDERHPLILAGGPCCQANPTPMAPFIDAFFIGDLEPVNDQLLIQGLLEPRTRAERMAVLDTFDWVWVPSLSREKTVKFAPKGDLNDYFYPIKQIIPQVEPGEDFYGVFGKTFMLEVVRGCNCSCSFCLTGKITRPKRDRSLQKLLELYRQGTKECAVDKTSLIGSGISDYKELETLCESIVNDGLKFSLPAIRADKITARLVQSIVASKQRTITTAPEAGTDELRKRICKRITNEEILEATQIASEGGLTRLKAYFILGLPSETKDDVEAIITLAEQMACIGNKLRTFRFTAGYFIPKPRTAFQNRPILSLQEMLTRGKFLLKASSRVPRVTFEVSSAKWAQIQTLLSISGEEIAPALESAAKQGGKLGDWRIALENHGIQLETIIEKPRERTEQPWEFIKI